MPVLFHSDVGKAKPARAKALNTAEILESILLALPESTIVAAAMSTCHGFKAAIEVSPMIKRKIWRLPKIKLHTMEMALPVGDFSTSSFSVVRDLDQLPRVREYSAGVSKQQHIVEGGLQIPTLLNWMVFRESDGHQHRLGKHILTRQTQASYKCLIKNDFIIDRSHALSLKTYAAYAEMQVCDPPATRATVRDYRVGDRQILNSEGVKVAEVLKAVNEMDRAIGVRQRSRLWDGRIYLELVRVVRGIWYVEGLEVGGDIKEVVQYYVVQDYH